MISRIIYENGRNYICEDCRKTERFKSILAAKAAGWGISRDYRRCYCPDCAPRHRHTGKYGAKIIRQEG